MSELSSFPLAAPGHDISCCKKMIGVLNERISVRTHKSRKINETVILTNQGDKLKAQVDAKAQEAAVLSTTGSQRKYNSSREEDSLFHTATPPEAGQPRAVPVLAVHTSLGMGPGQGLAAPQYCGQAHGRAKLRELEPGCAATALRQHKGLDSWDCPWGKLKGRQDWGALQALRVVKFKLPLTCQHLCLIVKNFVNTVRTL